MLALVDLYTRIVVYRCGEAVTSGAVLCAECRVEPAAVQRDNGADGDKAAEYEKLIDSRIKTLIGVKIEIIRAASSIDNPTYRAVLIARYVNFKKWEQIAVDMNFTYQWLDILHKRALQILKTVDVN